MANTVTLTVDSNRLAEVITRLVRDEDVSWDDGEAFYRAEEALESLRHVFKNTEFEEAFKNMTQIVCTISSMMNTALESANTTPDE